MFCGTAIALFCLVILPFTMNESPFWIISKYGSTLASYPYATLNAYNLFALTGANTAPVSQLFLFLPYGVLGNIFILLTVLFTTAVMLRGQEPCRFWYVPLFLSASVFVMTAKMHERYLFPALALALGFHIVTRDRLALLLFAGFSVTQFLNVAHVLTLSHEAIYGVPRLDPLLLAVSLANVVLWLLLVWSDTGATSQHPITERIRPPAGSVFRRFSGRLTASPALPWRNSAPRAPRRAAAPWPRHRSCRYTRRLFPASSGQRH